ncbi:hypothetical protein U8P76_23590 [Rhizobium johnstonii]|nr:hypothetical protein U8P76_23590 [Rhizobium johnstonii]
MQYCYYDMSEFCESIKEYPDTYKFIQLAYAYAGGRSQMEDFKVVADALKLMDAVDKMEDETTAGVIGGALLVQAVITYARATTTSGRKRSRVDVTKAFDRSQKQRHQAIIDLRDEAIAHHDGHITPEGVAWVNERVYVRRDEQGCLSSNMAVVRANYVSRVPNDIHDLLEVAWPHVNEQCRMKADILLPWLQTLLARPEIAEQFEKAPFDRKSFFGAHAPDDILERPHYRSVARGIDNAP